MNVVEDVSFDLCDPHFGHLSENGFNILAKKNFLSIKGTPLKICTHCFPFIVLVLS